MRTEKIDPKPILLITFLSLAFVMFLAISVQAEEMVSIVEKVQPPPTPHTDIFPASDRRVLTEPLVIQPSRTPAGRFNARMIFLADQLERNVERKSLANTFVVTSFTNLNKITETSGLGRLIGENLMHELQVRRWQVFEMRMARDININDTGEITLSRNSAQLKNSYKLGGVVTGTYSMTGNDIIVNARVVDIATGLVISSAQTHLPVDLFTEMLLFTKDGLPEMKIVGN
jgi:TolB-like protein